MRTRCRKVGKDMDCTCVDNRSPSYHDSALMLFTVRVEDGHNCSYAHTRLDWEQVCEAPI